MALRILLLLAATTLASLLSAQELNRAKLDSLFDRLDAAEQNMGSVALLFDGQPIYQRAIGYLDVDQQLKAEPSTHYRIGSISKSFTATLIVQLVEQGALSLDAPLSDFYPAFEHADSITIQHLLQHRSGIANFTENPSIAQWMYRPISREALLDSIISGGSQFEPGSTTAYSNSNFVLLGWIAEEISGKSYAELLEERICRPCNLNDTYLGGKIDIRLKEARSYQRFDQWEVQEETDMSIALAAGAIVSTASDIARFYHCLLATDKLVNEESRLLMTDTDTGMGMGVFAFPFYDRQAIGHNGSIDGFQSMAGHFQDDGLSVAYLSNGGDYSINDILIGILSIYYRMDYQIPAFSPGHQVDTDILDSYVGIYSNPNLPIDLTISRKGSKLIGQGSGQPEFVLKAVSDTEFTFEQADVKLIFPQPGQMRLLQAGMDLLFTRQEE